MSRLLLAVCAGSFLLTMGPSLMIAQNSPYDENALRIDEHAGTISILRGTSETVVAKIGVFRAVDLTSVVSPSPNAVAQARIFQSNYRPGSWISAVGIATFGAAMGISRLDDVNRAIPTGMTIVGIGLMAWGGSKLEAAQRALSKSVWWYNRDLTK